MTSAGGPMYNSENIINRPIPSLSGESRTVRQTDNSAFAEDFEEYSTGAVPSDFVLAGNTDQGVVSESSSSGPQAYRMSGSHGGCWRAIARTPIETADTMIIRGSFKRGDGSVGCHEDQSGGIRLRTVASSSWSEGSPAGLLRFKPDGSVASNGEVVGEYVAGEWTDFEITYNRANGTVTHECVINGKSPVSVERDVVSHEDELSALELQSDDFTVYWDDLSITTKSSEDSAEIHDWNDLHATRDNLDGNYVLTADLDSDTAGYNTHVENPENGWEPIGSNSSPFTGTFDGNGHSIEGLNFEAPPFNESTYEDNEEYLSAGLFAVVSDCVIKNLSLRNVKISGWGFVGGLVGSVSDVDGSSFSNLSIQGSILSSNNESYCGGVLGNVSVREGPIELRQIESNVTVEGAAAGGICGGFSPEGNVADADHIIEDTHATGTITGEAASGGIAGSLFNGTLRRVSASAVIQNSKNQPEGGYSSFKSLGGLVGNCERTVIDRSFSIGSVLVSDLREEVQAFAGGITGTLAVSSEIRRSYSTASVSSSTTGNIGGLVGLADGASISMCFAAGEVSGGRKAGGLVSQPIKDDSNPDVQITDTFWDVDTTGQSSSFGVGDANGLSTEKMTGEDARENLRGFDFGEIWEVTDEYPILSWAENRAGVDTPTSQQNQTKNSEPTTVPTDEYEFQAAQQEVQVQPIGTELLVLKGVPGADGKPAVTTTDYQLVDTDTAQDAFTTFTHGQSGTGFNWESALEYARTMRRKHGMAEIWSQATNLGWDALATYAMAQVNPAAGIGPALELFQDSTSWALQEATDPYREAMSKQSQWTHTYRNLESDISDAESLTDMNETMFGFLNTAVSLYGYADDLSTIVSAAQSTYQASSSFTTAATAGGVATTSAAYYAALGVLVSEGVGVITSGFEQNAKLSAIGHAYSTTRIPVIERIIELENERANNTLSPCGAWELAYLTMNHHYMGAFANQGMYKYASNINESTIGGVWDTLVNVGEVSSVLSKRASDFQWGGAAAHYDYGQRMQRAMDLTQNSINREIDGSPTSLEVSQ